MFSLILLLHQTHDLIIYLMRFSMGTLLLGYSNDKKAFLICNNMHRKQSRVASAVNGVRWCRVQIHSCRAKGLQPQTSGLAKWCTLVHPRQAAFR